MIRFKFFLLILCFQQAFSQGKNSLSYERLYFDNDEVISTVEDKFKLALGFKNGYSFFSNYSRAEINLEYPLTNYNEDAIKRLYSIDLGLKKVFVLNENLNLNVVVNPQVRTNKFSASTSDNFNFNSSFEFQKKINNKAELTLGLVYGTLFGKSSFYPVFDYKYSFSDTFKMDIGFPKTTFKYNWFPKNDFVLAIEYDSYYSVINDSYSRLKNDVLLDYKSLFINKTLASLSYNYTFFDTSVVHFSIGKSFNNSLKIEENTNETSKYEFNNNLMISVGLKFNLNK